MKNYYEELEVSRNASSDVINKAYKVLAKKYHPDSTSENKQQAEERFKRISEAYETLSNEQKKLEYDKNLELTQPEVNPDDYLKLLENHKKLINEVSSLKNQINTLNSIKTNNINTSAYYTNNIPYSNVQHVYHTVNTGPRKTKSYSFFDMIKFKIKNFFRKVLAILLTILIIFIIICILLYIPVTKDFILNDLNFNVFFNLFR